MKKITLILLIQIISFNTFSQIKHSINLEYNIGSYLDNQPFRTKPLSPSPRPPFMNYQIFYKNYGIEFSYKFLELAYIKNPYSNPKQLLKDSTITGRSSAIYGLFLLKKINIKSDKLFYIPKIGIGYIRSIDFYHLAYRNPNGPLTEPIMGGILNKSIIYSIGSNLEYNLFSKINCYISICYFNKLQNYIQKQILTTDIGMGYIINRRKK